MKEYEKYDFTKVSSEESTYEFASIGPKGIIKKVVEFEKTYETHIFNLAFGNVNDDGSVDDLSRDNNGDRNKILATVAAIIMQFSSINPGCYISILGSTKARTRLYRIAISSNYQELTKTFYIWGLSETGIIDFFDETQDYLGILIKRK